MSVADPEGLDPDLLCGVCYSQEACMKLQPCTHRLCAACMLEISRLSLQPKLALLPLACPFCRGSLAAVEFDPVETGPRESGSTSGCVVTEPKSGDEKIAAEFGPEDVSFRVPAGRSAYAV